MSIVEEALRLILNEKVRADDEEGIQRRKKSLFELINGLSPGDAAVLLQRVTDPTDDLGKLVHARLATATRRKLAEALKKSAGLVTRAPQVPSAPHPAPASRGPVLAHLPTADELQAGERICAALQQEAYTKASAYWSLEPNAVIELIEQLESIRSAAESSGLGLPELLELAEGTPALQGLLTIGVPGTLGLMGVVGLLSELGPPSGTGEVADRRRVYYKTYVAGLATGLWGGEDSAPKEGLLRVAYEDARARTAGLSTNDSQALVGFLVHHHTSSSDLKSYLDDDGKHNFSEGMLDKFESSEFTYR